MTELSTEMAIDEEEEEEGRRGGELPHFRCDVMWNSILSLFQKLVGWDITCFLG
jgi:hypothetical protein